MKIKNTVFFLFALLFIVSTNTSAQTACTALGQNPETAFPVCGTSTFSIASVPLCGDRSILSNCPFPNTVNDKNPYWYKFTCFASGTLGFLITPLDLNDDYDWAIYDITNANPNNIYTNPNLLVEFNWGGTYGITGTSSTSTITDMCDVTNQSPFSTMPLLVQGHQYLLLVSHYSDSQSGYTLSFAGGTASITDPLQPAMLTVRASCDATKISIKLNKNMKCASLDADGSDFSISPAFATITGAVGVNCSTSFDIDSVVLILSNSLPVGNYNVTIKNGGDGNTLLDNCGQGIPVGQTLPVTVLSGMPTAMDNVSTVGCAPKMVDIVFKDLINCSSIAADGSDFVVTGPSGVVVTGAMGVCNANGFTNLVHLQLSAPIQVAGKFQVTVQTGTDGNTLVNECKAETIAGSFLNFETKAAVSAAFTYHIRLGCIADTVDYMQDGLNGITSWQWLFDNSIQSNLQDTTLIYNTFGTKIVTLTVSNGICSDVATATILLGSKVKAKFLQSTQFVCPGDLAVFTNNSVGPITNWSWNFGNGTVSMQQVPAPQYYPFSNSIANFQVQLVVQDKEGCTDIATNTIGAGNCFIAVPSAFSPNGDGLNDFLFPNYSPKIKDFTFRIYNRWGQLLFERQDWAMKWDGTFKGKPQGPGTYVWALSYTDDVNGKKVELKGTSILIR